MEARSSIQPRPAFEWDPEKQETAIGWIGDDDRGEELEVVAIERDDCLLAIHVMPTKYREKRR